MNYNNHHYIFLHPILHIFLEHFLLYQYLQFHFFPYLVINHGLENPNFEAFQFHVCPNRPKSRGFVKIKTNNYKDDPKIQFNYLKHEDDLKQMREGVGIAKKILSQNALKEYVGT